MLTDRLELVAATLESCEAETAGPGALAAVLRARVPDAWPPPVFEADEVERVRGQLRSHSELAHWTLYYVLERPAVAVASPSLIGIAGFIGPPTSDGVVEIGYAIVSDYQRRGYATEAVTALVSRAFADPAVRRITATTYETLQPSIRVLQKSGFIVVAGPDSTGLVRFELSR